MLLYLFGVQLIDCVSYADADVHLNNRAQPSQDVPRCLEFVSSWRRILLH